MHWLSTLYALTKIYKNLDIVTSGLPVLGSLVHLCPSGVMLRLQHFPMQYSVGASAANTARAALVLVGLVDLVLLSACLHATEVSPKSFAHMSKPTTGDILM